ncbi:Polysaccharide deacetylase [Streptoalloteichus tenebrarius]|uniref:Polysaccharide deacetylase n=1 Tax=Streptoalloteichus tenebrarius (strain ATCC 17920 / DSM 40477 / JCM 4838 / CBS 697.72 / NBRC 16177 / NCIMB 11028 / NRRL B-12390 / A12253. 1 / ISP 5477) TaxID=1933 RepID=A0ABT1HLK0_STRSD|nr:polysaccharide deacetylase family protein [Streptoalloteichus tenebrarius]MCP2256407.1 Polysaccharide deacetylase [Streptoalloteichus tenebrarius]BFF04756.1 hypothetical protein GCM10020241_64310 [Streptoalloteichus tenebrarius]
MFLRTFVALALVFALPTPAHAASEGRCDGYVALTYDDGPNGYTRPLLRALRSVGARATFFDVGFRMEKNPDDVRATVRAGMWLGNHTWSHPHLPQLAPDELTEELDSTQEIIHEITGRTPTLFRPPYGDTNPAVRAEAARQGMAEVLWTVDTLDWSGRNAQQIIDSALTAKARGIVLMHDGYQPTVDAVEPIVRGLRAKGLCPGKIVNRDGTPVVTAP